MTYDVYVPATGLHPHVVLGESVVERPDPPAQVVLGPVDVVLLVVVLERELGAPLAEANGVSGRLGVLHDGPEGLDVEDLIDGEAAPVRSADADGDHGPVGVCAGVDVDVLLVDAPAWPVAAGAHRDAAAEVLGVICHAGVTAMPLPRSTNQSPCSHQTVLRCFAMQTS